MVGTYTKHSQVDRWQSLVVSGLTQPPYPHPYPYPDPVTHEPEDVRLAHFSSARFRADAPATFTWGGRKVTKMR